MPSPRTVLALAAATVSMMVLPACAQDHRAVTAADTCQPRNIGGPDTSEIYHGVEESHEPVVRTIAIGKGQSVQATYDFTNQGNGTLKIANLLLRPYSEADSTENYQGQALDVLLFPDSVTGFCSIAVSGIVEETSEKDDAVVARRPALAIYRRRDDGTFVREVETGGKLFDLSK